MHEAGARASGVHRFGGGSGIDYGAGCAAKARRFRARCGEAARRLPSRAAPRSVEPGARSWPRMALCALGLSNTSGSIEGDSSLAFVIDAG
jgi:hypothetical protein